MRCGCTVLGTQAVFAFPSLSEVFFFCLSLGIALCVMLRRNNAMSFATFHPYDCLCVVGGEFKGDVDWEYFCKIEGKLMPRLVEKN